MTIYPNQKIIRISKQKYDENFLQVSNEEWQCAARNLSGVGFKLYLYLAGNKNGFELALSQKAFGDATGASRNAYHRAVDELISKGYITNLTDNTYIFTTNPQVQEVSTQNGHMPKIGIYPEDGEVCPQNRDNTVLKMGREIDNTDKIDNDSTTINSCPEEKESLSGVELVALSVEKRFVSGDGLPGRRIRDLSEDEAKEIKAKLKQNVPYLDIEREYGMRHGTITSKFEEHWRAFIFAKANRHI